MVHYCREEWLFFTNNRLAPSKRHSMEEHLRECDSCLETYISTILPGVRQAEKALSEKFLIETMKMVKKEKNTKAASRATRLLQYYAVAAAVTLVLMTGGWFDFLAQKFPETAGAGAEMVPLVEERMVTGFSEKLLDKLSFKIDLITDGKEGVKFGQE